MPISKQPILLLNGLPLFLKNIKKQTLEENNYGKEI